MSIEIPQQMVDAFSDEAIERGTEVADLERVQVWDGLVGALENITPEAKRDLAAQLLRSANKDEGHPEGAPNENAMTSVPLVRGPGRHQCRCVGLVHAEGCRSWVLPA